MRELRYFLELSDAAHQDETPVSYAVAEGLLRGMDWKVQSRDSSGEASEPASEAAAEPVAPFMLFLDEGESFFMLMPEGFSGSGPHPELEGYRVTARVRDKWNLLGLVTKDKSFTLNFGLIGLDDALSLLKLFYEDNYPALRALEKRMSQGA